jgi:hypothetical protein
MLNELGDLQMLVAIYGVDTGVYNANRQGDPLSNTTLAWARFNRDAFHDGMLLDDQRDIFITGRDIRRLVDLLKKDIESQTAVAIGFEAPMWIPSPRDMPSGGRLFAPRPRRVKHRVVLAVRCRSDGQRARHRQNAFVACSRKGISPQIDSRSIPS